MRRWIRFLLCIAILLQVSPALAQSQATDNPVYIVQKGDTLNVIALRFGVSPADLAAVNGITDPNSLRAGARLIIPGLDGIQGILTTQVLPYGETLSTVSRRYQVPDSILVRLNHLTSPLELYAGYSLIVPQGEQDTSLKGQTFLGPGQSLLEAAVLSGINPWTLAGYNQLDGSWQGLAGDRLFYNNPSAPAPVGAVTPTVEKITVTSLPLVQGKTAEIQVTASKPTTFSGSLGESDLHFFQMDANQYVALQGIYGMAKAGLYPLKLKAALDDGSTFQYEQMVLVRLGYYPKDPPLVVPPETLDPAVTKPEEDLVAGITKPATPVKDWSVIFRDPVDKPICIRSWFGDRRSYNGSDYIYFHTGLDYGVCANLNIYAPAPGVVVYTGLMTVRGNATIIDHGWGVYSGFYHQSKILVEVGQKVVAGDKIGLIGDTGRVNGPHLHWDLFVNGIQVDPQDWLATRYP